MTDGWYTNLYRGYAGLNCSFLWTTSYIGVVLNYCEPSGCSSILPQPLVEFSWTHPFCCLEKQHRTTVKIIWRNCPLFALTILLYNLVSRDGSLVWLFANNYIIRSSFRLEISKARRRFPLFPSAGANRWIIFLLAFMTLFLSHQNHTRLFILGFRLHKYVVEPTLFFAMVASPRWEKIAVWEHTRFLVLDPEQYPCSSFHCVLITATQAL